MKMGYEIDIIFYVRPKPVNRKMISGLVKAVMDLGSNYDIYWSDKDDRGPFEGPLEEAIKVVSRDQGAFWFYYKDLYYLLGISPTPITRKLGWISIHVEEAYFWIRSDEDKKEAMRNIQQLIDAAKAVWNALEPKPIYGIGDYGVLDSGRSIPTDDEILNLRVEPFIFWFNFYGPELIKKLGKEKLLSMPAYKVEELNDGVLFVERPLIFEYDERRTHKKICDHLSWKIYFVDVFEIERFKPKVREIGAYGKEFQDINALKEYLELDIDEFRDRVEGGRVFVMLETPSTKPVPEHVRDMERWLSEEMKVEVKVIR